MSSVGTRITPPTAPAPPAAGAGSRRTRQSAANGGAPVTHLSVAERIARGKAARAEVPRSSHAAFKPSSRRGDPVKLLERQAKTRVPELVPIRYGRMLVSPFTFYRGAAMIMASDLAGTPRSGLTVQCCGDAHLSNFGVFGSPERRLVFDLNDFDETLPGPWEWDVKRLAVSMLIAAQSNGFDPADQDRIVLEAVREYRTAMLGFATMKNLDVWYARLDVEGFLGEFRAQLTPTAAKRTKKALAKARTKDSMSAFSKLVRVVDGEARIVADAPLIVPMADLVEGRARDDFFEELHGLLLAYRNTLQDDRRMLLEQFRLTDIARKVVGVGSVGTRAWIALLLGRDGEDPLFLQMKEAEASVMEEFLAPSEFENHGERVVAGQRLMQASSDIFLGWVHIEAGIDGNRRDFYVRQLKDWKGSAEIEQMVPAGMTAYGRVCGWTLARAHARSGDRVAIAAYLGKGTTFDRALVEFSHAYAEQNERDYKALAQAVESGRIEAQTGV
ncbi:MAG TPA: DUF2252 domain-containing protein [Solirubrobacteraceae bacterium]|jgi:uncharacterized protein (DUF2252 family)|nr:DUF2252 domain-containing protein [Solirubrobacteraceae bacterium]